MIVSLSHGIGSYLYEVFVVKTDFWFAFGLGAQLVFTARFLVQWIESEREGRSVIPLAFWVLSMVGGLMTLAYGMARKDAIIILGQVLSIVIYARNLMLIARTRRTKPLSASTARPDEGPGSRADGVGPGPAHRAE